MEKGALIGQGRTADVYQWGTDRILKLYQTHMPVQAVKQEYRITQAAAAAGLPVPAVDQLVEVEGRFGIVFERIEGPSMLKLLSAQPWKLVSFARQLGELHAQIHRYPAPDDFPSQREEIQKAINSLKDLTTTQKEAVLSYLDQLSAGSALCHGDFHPDNILMTARGPMIIDWMTGTRGSPLADVCRSSMIFQTSGMPPGTPLYMHILINLMRGLIDRIYVRRYLQVSAASRQQMTAWMLPLMTARLREVQDYPAEKNLLLKRINQLQPAG